MPGMAGELLILAGYRRAPNRLAGARCGNSEWQPEIDDFLSKLLRNSFDTVAFVNIIMRIILIYK